MTTSNKLPKTEYLYIGIDQSLTCTSLCIYKDQGVVFKRLKPLYMGVSRISEIYSDFAAILDELGPENIRGAAIEGYAYGAKGAVFNLGELGGVLRVALYQRNIRTIEVPPTYLKKHMTGKGTSPKNLMLKEAYKRYGIDLDDDNDSDAFALAMLARDYYETTIHPVKSYRDEFHKQCKLIIGKHPTPIPFKEYFQGMPDVTIAEYEKQKKQAKKDLDT